MRFNKFVKLTDHTHAWKDLTHFECVVHAMKRNGIHLNLQKLHGKTREIALSEFIFGEF